MNFSNEENDEEQEDVSEDADAVARWLRSAVSRVAKDQPSGQPVKKLKVTLAQDGSMIVESYEITPGSDVSSLAAEIYERARTDAFAIGGGAYFVRVEGLDARWALSFEGSRTQQSHGGRTMVPYEGRMQHHGGHGMGGGSMGQGEGPYGRGGFGGGAGPGGPPPGFGSYGRSFSSDNPVGVLFQAVVTETASQRDHNARLLELAIGGQVDMMKMMKGALMEAHETIRTYERERRSNIMVLEDLHSKKHERDMAWRKQEKGEQMKERVFEFFEPLALGAAARFFGGKGVPAEMSPLLNTLMAAFKDMDGSQFQRIVTSGLFSESQATALVEAVKVLQQIHGEKEAGEANGQASTNGHQNGAATNGASR